MSSWWPDLSDVLAPLGLSSRPIEPGGSFHEDATLLVDGRQFGPTHTVTRLLEPRTESGSGHSAASGVRHVAKSGAVALLT